MTNEQKQRERATTNAVKHLERIGDPNGPTINKLIASALLVEEAIAATGLRDVMVGHFYITDEGKVELNTAAGWISVDGRNGALLFASMVHGGLLLQLSRHAAFELDDDELAERLRDIGHPPSGGNHAD